MTARILCIVPGCRRTTAKPHREWICNKHWMAVPRLRRRVWYRIKRRGETWSDEPIWQRLRTAAIERAVGIG